MRRKGLALIFLAILIFGVVFWTKKLFGATVDFGLTPQEDPWYQTKGGDIYGKEGVSSEVRSGKYLSQNLDGYSGVVVSGGSIYTGDGGVSESSEDWQKTDETITSFSKETRFGYQYFDNKFGSEAQSLTGSTLRRGDIGNGIYKTSGSILSLDGNWTNFSNKAIIFVNGSLSIDKDITITSGGFLAFIVKEDLEIDPRVGANPRGGNPNEVSLEGVFIVDGTIRTGESSNPGNERLVARGIFVADANLDGEGGFTFQRDLGKENESFSAEHFEYRPDLLFSAPAQFLKETLSWEEIVP